MREIGGVSAAAASELKAVLLNEWLFSTACFKAQQQAEDSGSRSV